MFSRMKMAATFKNYSFFYKKSNDDNDLFKNR